MADDLEFFFGGMAVGYFLDVADYPVAPGACRYMPYRGPGHYEMCQEIRRAGFAKCTYPTTGGDTTFIVRWGPGKDMMLDGFSFPAHRSND